MTYDHDQQPDPMPPTACHRQPCCLQHHHVCAVKKEQATQKCNSVHRPVGYCLAERRTAALALCPVQVAVQAGTTREHRTAAAVSSSRTPQVHRTAGEDTQTAEA